MPCICGNESDEIQETLGSTLFGVGQLRFSAQTAIVVFPDREFLGILFHLVYCNIQRSPK